MKDETGCGELVEIQLEYMILKQFHERKTGLKQDFTGRKSVAVTYNSPAGRGVR